MTFEHPLHLLLALALAGVWIAGCGEQSQGSRSEITAIPRGGDPVEPKSEYHQVLLEFRDAAAAGKIFDAYGFAEYFPPTQRAAVHAFCFVADRMLEARETARLLDSVYLTTRIERKAEADMKSELGVVAPRRTQRAVRKLKAVLQLGSLDQDLAERFVRACY